MERLASHWINSEWVNHGELVESVNPATGEVIGHYHDGGEQEAKDAIAAASQAFRETRWRHDGIFRADVLTRLAERFDEHTEEFIETYKLENGKPEARQEISRVSDAIRYWSAMARTEKGQSGYPDPATMSITIREPVGVVGVIVPWNSPIILALRSINPALAAGCTVAAKMPGQTAQVNALLSQVFSEVEDLPPGTVNFFNERGAEGSQLLVSSPQTQAISFTGGTSTGSSVGKVAGELVKRCGLELGGKNAHLIFEDAELSTMMPVLRTTAMRFGGQFCEAGSRVIVHVRLADEVRSALVEALQSIRVGPAADPETELGPLIDKANVARVDKVVQDAIAQGATPLLRGGPVTDGPLAKGSFFRPALLDVTDPQLDIVQEEIFGPVMTIETFSSEQEGVALMNGTKYGLGASVWTRDLPRAFRVARDIEAGMVWINDWGKVRYQFEEGGYKMSGLGRLNGPAALDEFTEIKHITFSIDPA